MISAHPAKLLFRDREEFRSFHEGEEQSFLVIALLYAVALAAIALAWAGTRMSLLAAIPSYVIAFFVIGWAQYSLGNAMHEAVHKNLCNNSSDILASLLTAYPIGLAMTYRDFHLRHHRHLGTPEDPELQFYSHFPDSKLALIGRFLWFSSGCPAVLQFIEQQATPQKASARKQLSGNLLTFIAVQIVIATLFWISFGNPIYYVIFWALPVATVGKLLSTTRLLCEHSSPSRDWVVRTLDGSRWQTWLMGAFDFNYHGEHHLFASVPYAQLHRLHQLHRKYFENNPEYQPFEGRYEIFQGGYLTLILYWFRMLPWMRPIKMASVR